MYRAFRSDRYGEKLSKLDTSDQDRVKSFEQGLKENPYTGKPLGYKFFREKKFDGKRMIYIIYEEHKIVFLVTITDKKAQRLEIAMIKAGLDTYKEEMNRIIEHLKSTKSQ